MLIPLKFQVDIPVFKETLKDYYSFIYLHTK